MNISTQILSGMARAFFACAYADQADECGQPLGGEIMDQLPADTDPAALHAAETLARDLVAAHDFVEPGLAMPAKLIRLYTNAERIQRQSSDSGDRELTPELFGHYLAMQAMGTGVGLESFGNTVREFFAVPYAEFGSHSLQRDYFESGDQ